MRSIRLPTPGLIATVKVNDQWLVQLGITGGHDVALVDFRCEAFRDGLPELYDAIGE